MKVKLVETGEVVEAQIEVFSPMDFKQVAKSKGRFQFHWKKYISFELYKLILSESNKIVGLICIKEHKDPETTAIEIELLEVVNENVGPRKLME